MRECTWAVRDQTPDPVDAYTDDLWRSPWLSSWLGAAALSVLLVQGDAYSAARLALFGADLAAHVAGQRPLAHVPSPVPQPTMCWTASQVLRHVTVEALRAADPADPLALLVETVRAFGSADGPSDWFGILETVLSRVSVLYIVVHETYQVVREARSWAHDFQDLVDKVGRRSPRSVIKVVLLSCCTLAPPSTSTERPAIVTVPQPDLRPGLIRSLSPHRAVVPRNLPKLGGAERVDESGGSHGPEPGTDAAGEGRPAGAGVDPHAGNKPSDGQVLDAAGPTAAGRADPCFDDEPSDG